MGSEVEEKLKTIINPKTNKSLVEEGRILEVKTDFGELVIRYKRDGIAPLEKREIEKQFVDTFASDFPIENIKIHTISERSSEVYESLKKNNSESKPETQQAGLKVGHAPAAQKRKVEGIKNILAVASGKGGVGKSTFSTNLAISLKNLGFKVGLIDADIYGPSLPMLMGKRGVKPYSNEKKKIIPIEAHGIHFMSFGFFIGEEEPVIWRGPMLGGVLSQFLFDVDWNGCDYLIIDLPPGTGDIQLSMVQNTDVDGVIIISTPQDVALMDATKGLEMFRKVNVPIVGMVENMSSFICDNCDKEHLIFGQGGVESAARKLNLDFLGSIPIEVELREASDIGIPYMSRADYSEKKVYKSYMAIAEKIKVKNKTKKEAGFLSKLFSSKET